jgi:hypothetical protein
MIIAKKTSTKDEWLAWIPIVNFYLMCKIAKKPGWWIVLFFIPLVNLIFIVIVWMEIAKTRNKPGWLGILIILPGINLIIPGILAFTD